MDRKFLFVLALACVVVAAAPLPARAAAEPCPEGQGCAPPSSIAAPIVGLAVGTL